MKRALLRILAGFILLIIIILALALGLAKRYVVKHSPELVGRAINIDLVYYNDYEKEAESIARAAQK